MPVIRLTAAELQSHVWASDQEVIITDSGGSYNFAQTRGTEKIRLLGGLDNIRIECEASSPPWFDSYIDLKTDTLAGEWSEVDPTDPSIAQPSSNLWRYDIDGSLIGSNSSVFTIRAVPDEDLIVMPGLWNETNIPFYYFNEEYSRRQYVRNGQAYYDANLPGGPAQSVPQKRGQWGFGDWGAPVVRSVFLYCEGNPVSGSYYGAIAAEITEIFLIRDCTNITMTNFRQRHAWRLFVIENATADTTISGFEVSYVTAKHCGKVGQVKGGSDIVAGGGSTTKAYVDEVNLHHFDVEWNAAQVFDITNWLKDIDIHHVDMRYSGVGGTAGAGTGLIYCDNTARPEGYKMRVFDCTTYFHAYGQNDWKADGPALHYHDSTDGDPTNIAQDYYQHALRSETFDCTVTGALDAIHTNSGQADWRVWNIVCYDLGGSVMRISDSLDSKSGGEYYAENCSVVKTIGDRWQRGTVDAQQPVQNTPRAAFAVSSSYEEDGGGPFAVTNCAVFSVDGFAGSKAYQDTTEATTDPANSLLQLSSCKVNSAAPLKYTNTDDDEFSPATGLTIEDDLGFVSASDARLRSTSPLIDAGEIVDDRPTDRAGTVIDRNSLYATTVSDTRDDLLFRKIPDIGAYEYVLPLQLIEVNIRIGAFDPAIGIPPQDQIAQLLELMAERLDRS